MSHIKRIFSWTIFLIGSAVLFYFWATNQMFIINSEESEYTNSSIATSTPKLIKFNPEYYIISTSSMMQILFQKDLYANNWSSSTLKISSTTIDSTNFKFIFPNKKSVLYQNCKYKIYFDLVNNVKYDYMGVTLVDAGTQKEVKPKDSGLVHSLTFKENKFLWSIGNIWPGEYYLLISMLEGKEVVMKSEKFLIEENLGDYMCE